MLRRECVMDAWTMYWVSGVVLSVFVYCWIVYEDVVRKAPMDNYGWGYKSEVTLMLCAVIACPGVNVWYSIVVVHSHLFGPKRRQKRK